MVRTQIQLPEQDYQRLREIALRQHRSMADCIREGIEAFLQRSATDQNDLLEIAGRFKPLPTEQLKAHDRQWAEAIAGQKDRVSQ